MDGRLWLLTLFAIYFLSCETERSYLKPNHRYIKNCVKCPPGWGVSKKCVKNSDTECVKCVLGRTYSSRYSSKSRCWSCSRCGVGLYESRTCSPVSDTVCSECVSYLDHKNLTRNNDFVKKCAYLFL